MKSATDEVRALVNRDVAEIAQKASMQQLQQLEAAVDERLLQLEAATDGNWRG